MPSFLSYTNKKQNPIKAQMCKANRENSAARALFEYVNFCRALHVRGFLQPKKTVQTEHC